MKNTLIALLPIAMIAVLGHFPAQADPLFDTGFQGWGPRVGLSVDPDQVHFGAHLDYGYFGEHIRFQPNVEMGFSDHLKLFTVNAEAAYRFSDRWNVWSPYLGGGIGANFKSYDDDHGNDDSETDLGVNLLGGMEKGLDSGDRFFVEAKVSLNDVPDLKITVGWTFFH